MLRARSRLDKQGRKQAILKAAGRIWAISTFDEFTMVAVSREAGLAKGTLYLYFPTKEALLLALLDAALEQRFGEIERDLSALSGPCDFEGAERLLASTLLTDTGQVRLLAILGTVLEHNIPRPDIRRFKKRLLAHLERIGGALEVCLSFLSRGEGVRFLLRLHAVIIGVAQLATPAPEVAKILKEKGFEPFRIDFDTELRAMLSILVRGSAGQARDKDTQSKGGHDNGGR
jgi:AcrR family transcriptional regulator